MRLMLAIPLIGVVLLGLGGCPQALRGLAQDMENLGKPSTAATVSNTAVARTPQVVGDQRIAVTPLSPPPALVPVAAGGQDTPVPLAARQGRPDDVSPPGQGEPWYVHDQNLTRQQFAQALRADDPKVLRVRAAEIARQVADRGLPAPSTPAAFADWIEKDPHVTTIACTQAIVDGHYMSRTDPTGKLIDLHWAGRKACASGEQILTYVRDDGTKVYFESLWCGNVLTPREQPRQPLVAQVVPPPPPAPQAVAPDICRTVFRVRLWDPATFSADERRKMDGLIAAEKANPTSLSGPSFSRTMGPELLAALPSGRIGLSKNAVDVVVSQITLAPNGSILSEQRIGVGAYSIVNGVVDVPLPSSFQQGAIIRLLFSPGDVVYPLAARAGDAKEGRVRATDLTACKINTFHAAVPMPAV